MTKPIVATDPNPFHHAAALIEGMDRHDLDALTKLIEQRREELIENAPRRLKWVTTDGNGAWANGHRGLYRIMRFVEQDTATFRYCLSITFRDDSNLTHILSHASRERLKDRAEAYDQLR
jgi:hypothetical protein